jgi:hypothetical protein
MSIGRAILVLASSLPESGGVLPCIWRTLFAVSSS